MSDKKAVTVKVGGTTISLPALLTVLFVYLKLTGQIDWSWLWVTAPAWIPFAVVFGILATVLIIALVGAVVAAVLNR